MVNTPRAPRRTCPSQPLSSIARRKHLNANVYVIRQSPIKWMAASSDIEIANSSLWKVARSACQAIEYARNVP